MIIFYIIVTLWMGWLLFNGLSSGEIWVKGGAKDRFTRDLDMHSFAHKVDRIKNPVTYWLHVCLYAAIIIAIMLALLNQ